MCKYCNVDKFGDNHGYIDKLDQAIEINGVKVFDIETFITRYEDGNWALVSYMTSTAMIGYSESVKRINIEFCPFCGRELN